MGLSLTARAGLWLDGVAVAAQDLREQLASAFLTGESASGTTGIAARPGVRYAPGTALLVQASSGMNVTVNAGACWVQGSSAANSGMYTVCLDTTGTVTVATADPTNPRIDNVIAQVTDLGTSFSTTVVTLQTGTPAASPVAPTLPANSLLLAQIAVAAGTSSIVAGNITDKRVYTVATGGILPVPSISGGISGPAGYYAHDLATGRLWVADGSGNARQPKVAALGAVSATAASISVGLGPFYSSAASVSVTADGVTEFEVYGSWTSLTPPAGVAAGDYVGANLQVDSVAIGPADTVVRVDGTSLNPGDGASLKNWVTPSAGTHTFTLAAKSTGHTFTMNNAFIRVAPSLQQ